MFRRSFWDELDRFHREMDRFFRNFWEESLEYESKDIVPRNYREPLTDMWETEKEVIITAELPGVRKEDIEINIKDDGLEIKVEKRDELKEERKGIYRLERRYAGFYRYIRLPGNVDIEKAEATYNNGVLEIRIPKIREEKEGKRIKIK